MKKKTISLLLTAALISPAISMTARAEESSPALSLSGYVSSTKSYGAITIADADKSAVIYVDAENDYEGVQLAAQSLANDIDAVTDTETSLTDTIAAEETVVPAIRDVVFGDGKITAQIENIDAVSDTGRGIIAVYNSDGSLKGISFSNETTDETSGEITFDVDFTYNSEKETYKTFLWKSCGEGIEPVPITSKGGSTNANIIVGTIGKSDAIDTLIESGKLDVSEIEGKWESFSVQEADGSIVIVGSDKRGTIYGIYDLSEKIGVSPWNWWADVTPTKCASLYAKLDEPYTEGEPSVKYRGIFINDELHLNEWSESLGDGPMNKETYEKVFELLLRLKANLLWPAMHPYSPAFNNDMANPENADKYGVVIGTSHCDMLLRNNMGEIKEFQEQWVADNPDKPLYTEYNSDMEYSTAYCYTDIDKNGNTVYNKEFLEDYWRDRVRQNKDYESIYTIGMRGVHDGEFSSPAASTIDEKTALMQEIIELQRKILSEELDSDITEIPQLYIPYKGALDIYNNGLNVPDDVMLMWPDDNFGYIRQFPTEDEQMRSGGNGIYYHLSYFGRPKSYLWLTSTQPGLIREEMTKAYDNGANKIWIVNVGDIKPAETDIEYFLDLARDIDTMKETDIEEQLSQNAKRDFGFDNSDAAEYADIQTEYYALANSRRPEHMMQGIFSITDYGDEGQKYIDAYKELTERSEALYNSLPESKKAAFFELQLYPLRSAYNIAADYIYTDKAELYAEQGRGASVNKYASAARAAANKIDADTDVYNTMLDGKWNKIMNLNADGLPWASQLKPSVVTSLETPLVSELNFTDMGIAVEGQTDITAAPSVELSAVSKQYKFIDIFNTGYGSFEWSAKSENGLIVFNETSGTVNDEHRIYITADWSELPNDNEITDTITITASIGGITIKEIEIPVTINNPSYEADGKTYVEADGYISIEAEHYTDLIAKGEYEWRIEKDFGRSGDSLKIYPNNAEEVNNTAADVLANSAYAEYDIYFTQAGTYTINIYRMPTLNERGYSRFAVGMDNESPTVIGGTNKVPSSNSDAEDLTKPWAKGVVANTEILTATVKVSEVGVHTLKLYNVSSGMAVDKIVLTNSSVPDSYFGAPESYNSYYNNEIPQLPAASEVSESDETGTTKLFEPKLITAGADIENNVLNTVTVAKLDECDSAVCAAAFYDEDGALINVEYRSIDLSDAEINSAVTVSFETEISVSAAALSIMTFNSFDDLYALSPVFDLQLTEDGMKATPDCDTVTLTSDLSEYTGRQALVIISKSGEDIEGNTAYIKQESVKQNMYKSVPFNAEQGEYDVKIGVPYIDTFTEQLNNTVNVIPDNEGTEEELYSWTFDTSADIGSTGESDIPVLSGEASYSEENGMIKMSEDSGYGGFAQIDFSTPQTAFQGSTLTVQFDVYYGAQSKKYMNYEIKDSSGNNLVYSHICGYGSVTDQTIAICGENMLTGDELSWPSFLTSKNPSTSAGAVTYTHEFDFDEGTITITASSSKGTETFTGAIDSAYTGDIGTIKLYSYHSYSDRSCYVDNILLTRKTDPQYEIAIEAADENGNTIDNAAITVTERGIAIPPDTNGKYMLCKGEYTVEISADGYSAFSDTFAVAPSMESKNVRYTLEAAE